MSLLRAELDGIIRNVPDLNAIATSLSRQAITLYRNLGSRMAELGNESARKTFEHIEAIQREHAGAVAQPENSEAPKVFHAEGLNATRLVTPYKAYSLAVRNEERAFAYWSYVSAHTANTSVQAEAERLAHLELDHVRELRAERRRAYHEGVTSQFTADWARSLSLADFKAQAAQREAALAALHKSVALALADTNQPLIAELRAIAREETVRAGELGSVQKMAERSDVPGGDADALLAMAIEQLESAVELYLTVAEQSLHEDVVAVAQESANQGIGRLSRLR